MISSPYIHIWSLQYPTNKDQEEECQAGGKDSKDLANHLAMRLRLLGYNISAVSCEKCGWWIEIADDPCALGLAVRSSPDVPSTRQFLITIGLSPKSARSWPRSPPIETNRRVSMLFTAVDEILSRDPDVEIIDYPDSSPF